MIPTAASLHWVLYHWDQILAMIHDVLDFFFLKKKHFVTPTLHYLGFSSHLLAMLSLLQGHASALLKFLLFWIKAWQETPKIMIHQENFAFLDPFTLLTTDFWRRKKRCSGKSQAAWYSGFKVQYFWHGNKKTACHIEFMTHDFRMSLHLHNVH